MEFSPPARPRRKPSLTPMIDVVFLLLVFFMLASRFGAEQVIPLPLASAGGKYSGPPRLITVLPDRLLLNGLPVPDLAAALQPMMQTPQDMLILRGREGATLQQITAVTDLLHSAGFTRFVLVE